MWTAFSLLPLSLSLLVSASLHRSLLPEDPYAFPKYRVSYLNGLPVLNDTAERWLNEGLKGGEAEFLDQQWDWSGAAWHSSSRKSIGGSQAQDGVSTPSPDTSSTPGLRLEHMRLGPHTSYLCLIPPPSEESTIVADKQPEPEVSPSYSWSLLQPLNGKCLYHKQGWFTYAYCHNSHVRQFHELPQQAPNRHGEYRPEEDTEWEAYTLGRAPPTPEPGADLTVAERQAIATNVELARGAGSHYLVQRWGDGTYCDKIGRKREIEVQFHCSMTMTDTILFVKETLTCHYVLHIATPRLCSVPGFKSRVDDRSEVLIRCREILDDDEYDQADKTLPSRDRPFKLSKKTKAVIAPPPAPVDEAADDEKPVRSALREALAKFLERDSLRVGADDDVFVEELEDGSGELVIQFVDIDGGMDGEDLSDQLERIGDSLAEKLQAAGYRVQSEDEKEQNSRGRIGPNGAEEDAEEAKQRRDEL